MTPETPSLELQAARDRLRSVADDLGGPREFGPRIGIVNPPRWEVGHVGWFQEFWCLRGGGTEKVGDSILWNADGLYNSATVLHDDRWDLALPDFESTVAYRDGILQRTLQSLSDNAGSAAAYFAGLAARHEDMHAEAFHYMRQTWGYDAPALAENPHPPGARVRGDVELSGGAFDLGAKPGADFIFDNERASHPVLVQPFRISRTAVSNRDYLEFVEAGGYDTEQWWTRAGWEWRNSQNRRSPLYWKKSGGIWMQRRFNGEVPLSPDEPVVHVSAHEASAYCRFSGRRLPTEIEWEYAATWNPSTRRRQRFPWGDASWHAVVANLENASLAPVDSYPSGDSPCGCRQMIGNVWEWTASAFLPFPGFLRDPYKEYSEPWFGTHTVLRGGCFTTSRRIAKASYRNFFTSDRADVFAGFRTCAL